MDAAWAASYAEEIYRAWREGFCVAPLSEREPSLTVDEAYDIQLRWVGLRIEGERERAIGKKIGVTSEAVQSALGVNQPDFGQLTSGMHYEDGDVLPMAALIQPRAEGEIAFVLKRDLVGPGVSEADVLPATDCVIACSEIVDSRIRDWKIRIQDTVADNASCGVFVMGQEKMSPARVDLLGCAMVFEKNGEVVGRGRGAATLGSPLRAVAWLANALGRFGMPLRAGEVILSGSLGPLVPAARGDAMCVAIEGLGSVSFRFE